MKEFEDLHAELLAHIGQLECKFIAGYIPTDPSLNPSDYSHDVRAFCILSHAAFEEFIETIVLKVASISVKAWINERKSSDIIACLLCWQGSKLRICDDDSDHDKKPFDYLRELLNEAKSAYSTMVTNNHGISLKYLKSLLLPVNIELSQNATLMNSLKTLTENRGAFAHKWRAKNPLAPEDAKAQVGDVLQLCKDIKDKAIDRLK